MNKRISIYIMFALTITLILVFFSNQKQNEIKDESIIYDWLKNEAGIEPRSSKIINRHRLDDANYFLFFTFSSRTDDYEAIAFIDDNKLIQCDYVIIDNSPFTLHQLQINESTGNERYISGVINDTQIKYIVITYYGGKKVIIEPIDGRYYFDTSLVGFERVSATNEEFEEIYIY